MHIELCKTCSDDVVQVLTNLFVKGPVTLGYLAVDTAEAGSAACSKYSEDFCYKPLSSSAVLLVRLATVLLQWLLFLFLTFPSLV